MGVEIGGSSMQEREELVSRSLVSEKVDKSDWQRKVRHCITRPLVNNISLGVAQRYRTHSVLSLCDRVPKI